MSQHRIEFDIPWIDQRMFCPNCEGYGWLAPNNKCTFCASGGTVFRNKVFYFDGVSIRVNEEVDDLHA